MRNVVGIGQALCMKDNKAAIVTHPLGSCLGITIYDPVARVGGLFYPMLPEASVNPERAKRQPYTFVDKGFPLFLSEAESLGASRTRLIVKVAGGARMHGKSPNDFLDLGHRNYMALNGVLSLYNIKVTSEDLGGHRSRTVYLHLQDGQTEVISRGDVIESLRDSFPPELDEIVSRVDELPPFPKNAAHALELLDDPRGHVLPVAEVLQKDPALTACLLKLANSAYYSKWRFISTVLEAVVMLGTDAIRQLVVMACSYDLLNKKISGYLLEKGALWKHSLFVAMASQAIAEEVSPQIKSEAYITGLLHDIGKLVLAAYVEKSFAMIIDRVENQGLTFDEAEKDILRFSHAKLGGMILERWGFPKKIVNAIEFHHDPDQNQELLTCILHLADAMGLILGKGIGTDGMMYELCQVALKTVGLSRESFDRILLKADDAMNAAMKLVEA